MSRWQARGAIRIDGKGVQRLRAGHPWVMEDSVARADVRREGVVAVEDPKGRTFGYALYSPKSRIALRWLGDAAPTDEAMRTRMEQALTRRQTWLPGVDGFRWIHGEADGLPGLFVDQYGDAVVLQTTCAGTAYFEPEWIAWIDAIAKPRALVVRNDSAARRHEGLPDFVSVVRGAAPVIAIYHEGSIAYDLDLCADQKTGAFLDQRDNHLALHMYARGRALDCFSYHGGFALQMAARCTEVIAYDQSEVAVARIRRNAERASIKNVVAQRADVFAALEGHLEQGDRFDTIVLDPPAFASTAQTMQAATRAYERLNRLAMQCLVAGGTLVTCSCSGRVRDDTFADIIQQAAGNAKRAVDVRERRGASIDHPVLPTVPETHYLKCHILTVR